MTRTFGSFPFGRPNTVRPARLAERAEAVVVGVYPSAWHVTWSAPPRLACEGRTGGVKALAVDVEPTVFWDGRDDDFAARLAAWKDAVGFRDGEHGAIASMSPSTNGSSGAKVVDRYLAPLGLDPARVAFTDIYPVFVVKHAAGPRREQGDAIRDEYDPIAARMGVAPSSLPARPPSTRLPGLAAETFGDRLAADLAEAAAPLVVTLGAEVWETLLRVPGLRARPPRPRFEDLYGEAYGAVGALTVAGREVAWLPLVHPGLLKGKPDPDAALAPDRRTTSGWMTLHARWARGARGR